MLAKRFRLDGKSSIRLNELQTKTKEQIDEKVKQGIYSFGEVPCCICSNQEFDMLSEKDRYGLWMPVVICRNCGLIQTNPRMSQDAYRQFYETEQKKLYVGRNSPTDEYFANEYMRGRDIHSYIAKNMCMDLINLRILEVGCSAGGILEYFRQKGNQVCGCDLNPEYVAFGKSKYNLDLQVGSIDDVSMSWVPDIIVYSHTLEHILNPIDELTSVRSIIGNNPLLYITLPGVKNLTHSYQYDLLRYLQNAHVYHFTLTTLRNLLQVSGYDFICGDETIQSVFRVAPEQRECREIRSDYVEVMRFLRRLEYLHPLVALYGMSENTSISILARFLKEVGLYESAGKIYRWLKKH